MNQEKPATPMHELDNATWGFDSSCFVCERRNDHGLRISFYHDVERNLVTATFSLTGTFSGAPTWVHGGIVLAILDEATAWAAIAIAGRFAATHETSTTFERSVRVGRSYSVAATVQHAGDETIEAAATITDERGRVCATARATFTVLGEAQAERAIGGDVTPEAQGYVRRDPS
ncbi:MAG: PaaI family thioesterase [Acidimicrobiales bacterium]